MNGKEKTAILKRQLTSLGQGVLRIEGWLAGGALRL